MLHCRFEALVCLLEKRQLPMLVREDLDAIETFIAGITQCMEEGRYVEETIARKFAAMEGIVDERALDVGKRVVQFHRSDRPLWAFA